MPLYHIKYDHYEQDFEKAWWVGVSEWVNGENDARLWSRSNSESKCMNESQRNFRTWEETGACKLGLHKPMVASNWPCSCLRPYSPSGIWHCRKILVIAWLHIRSLREALVHQCSSECMMLDRLHAFLIKEIWIEGDKVPLVIYTFHWRENMSVWPWTQVMSVIGNRSSTSSSRYH